MFSDESFYTAKVFLKSVADAQSALKEAAEYNANLKQYQYEQSRLNDIKKQSSVNFLGTEVKKGPSFNDMKEVKLFQFTNEIFNKYFPGFDGYDHNDYKGFKSLLQSGFEKLQQ
ncbi:hypothetical protein PPERSA_07487 [Pseudocohnilembus persalinus]|uniref:Uncharacterized protein n=1 Tax=Pseudocohnilembus persalinus TaxID=266149 RepID=A0A0V0R2E1_PSEPJ|nr:hypothetical protein PPERSA_07487 [Pseudocohnilembus persalinus]|eukprot:KRX08675.1 hypothetical protein PPERSA_07487 [Pseudocohnilembus persalinus]